MGAGLLSYTGGKIGLKLDGVNGGYLMKCEGGNTTAEIIEEKNGWGHVTHKHLANPKPDAMKATLGGSVGKGAAQWIIDTTNNTPKPKNGAVFTLDEQMKERFERQFLDAYITEMTLPALDAAGKDPLAIQLSWMASQVRNLNGSGKVYSEPQDKLQQLFTTSQFNLTIDGLNCDKVKKVGAITLKQNVATDAVANLTEYQQRPAGLTFADLTVDISAVTAESWYKWHEDFVIKRIGHDGKQQKSGRLEYRSPDNKDVLFAVDFFGLGVYKVSKPAGEAKAQAEIETVQFTMFIESLKVDFQKMAG
jgi:hypothetical protein